MAWLILRIGKCKRGRKEERKKNSNKYRTHKLSHAGRYASYGSWKATSALAKGKYRLSSNGGIPPARARTQEDLLHSERRCARAARPREYDMRFKRSKYVFVTFGVFEVCNAYCRTSKSGIF